MTFTREQLQHFANLATERADAQAAAEYPEPGPKQDARACELMTRYYAEYVAPPPDRAR
jgi:hypothetical protein